MDIIYLHKVHKMPLCNIAIQTNINYSTIRTLASSFKRSGGRISKRLTFLSKKAILTARRRETKALLLRRAAKQRRHHEYGDILFPLEIESNEADGIFNLSPSQA